MDLSYSRETSPLATAGALRVALPLIGSDCVLVMNGNSFCSDALIPDSGTPESYGQAEEFFSQRRQAP